MEHSNVKSKVYGGIMMSETKELTFEEAISKLEDIVQKLEEEDIPLEKAIDYYQEGMKLSKICDDILKTAQEKMTNILKENGELEPFDLQEE